MATVSRLCLEGRRIVLEELEVIENAIAARLRRNPQIFYKFNESLADLGIDTLNIPKINISANRIYRSKKSIRSRKQVKAQEYEISLFLGRYRKLLKYLQQYSPTSEQNEYFKDPDMNFEKFEALTSEILENSIEESRSLEEIRDDYEMFSRAQGTVSNIISPIGQAIELSKKFSREENFGMYLDLSEQFTKWLNIIKSADLTMISFLRMLESFVTYQYLLEPSLDRNSKEYERLLVELLKYYKSYYAKVHPLVDRDTISKSIKEGFDKYLSTGISNSQPEGDGRRFSVLYDKWFNSQSEFDSFVSSADHNSVTPGNRRRLSREFTFHFYSRLLSKELQNTISLTERKLAFTDEELREDLEKLQTEYESPVYAANEHEDKPSHSGIGEEALDNDVLDPSNPFNLPLGPDNFPVPRWLYKVQGLDVKYPCEICGNTLYHGRKDFEKHFQLRKHAEGLKSLGIIPSSAFKDISTVAEARELWITLQAKSSSKTSDIRSRNSDSKQLEMVLEAEDEEGNVMSVEVYDELKKQGLL
ncbi:unnamed protein product [Kluyveromyces dobzhanskii CBS 2104]|uniref:WGS project CCBQ000000000 data, contig 00058 n=1 Tax=Kluyveromyces dobzhanskii CBS 2104 TaxID=1427455 RepID=A0A0A8LDN7_9SACH|nr:unnamed protein product [Kluyveromyces dobzhanskii CBS 2104]